MTKRNLQIPKGYRRARIGEKVPQYFYLEDSIKKNYFKCNNIYRTENIELFYYTRITESFPPVIIKKHENILDL